MCKRSAIKACSARRAQLLLIVTVILLTTPSLGTADTISSSCTSSGDGVRVLLSIHVGRNATGHWLMKMDALGDAGRGRNLSLDVQAEVRTPHRGAVHLASSTEVAVDTPPIVQPSGYERLAIGGSVYKLYTQAATWDDAAFRCLEGGAHLIIVDSETEAIVVRKLFARKPNITGADVLDYWHAGFHNRYNMSKTISVLGNLMPEWALEQMEPPEKYSHQRCGRVMHTGAYVRGTCDALRAFVCEFEQNI